MINIRDKDQLPSTVIMSLAVIVLLGALGLAIFPKPSAASLQAKAKSVFNDTVRKIDQDRATAADAERFVASQSFSDPAQTVEHYSIKAVSNLSYKHRVKLTGIRPQRPVIIGDLTQLPFLINVTGSFLDVLAFEKDLETSSNKLAVNSVQMSASDPSTDNVVVNINVVAYLNRKLSAGEIDG